MSLFDEIIENRPKNEDSLLLQNNSANKTTTLEFGVNRAYCEGCREIINLAKVDSWVCKCGNTWQKAPSM